MRNVSLFMFALLCVVSLNLHADEKAPGIKLWASVLPSEPLFKGDEVKKLNIHFSIVNDGSDTVATGIGGSRLIINGKPMEGSMMMFNNGPASPLRDHLPPGQGILFGYGFEWNHEFDKPGLYKLQWKGEHFTSKVVEFRVLPP